MVECIEKAKSIAKGKKVAEFHGGQNKSQLPTDFSSEEEDEQSKIGITSLPRINIDENVKRKVAKVKPLEQDNVTIETIDLESDNDPLIEEVILNEDIGSISDGEAEEDEDRQP